MASKVKSCVDALIRLQERSNLNEITVVDLIEEAKMKRATFYYYFGSIKDVIVSFFLEYTLQNFNKMKEPEDLIKALWKHFDLFASFVRAIGNSNYLDVLFEAVYQWSLLFFRKHFAETKARFTAYGFSNIFVTNYLRDNKNQSELLKIIKDMD